jgi:hypothetical protein
LGIPHNHEWRFWLEILREALCIDRAAAIIHYIRWRAKGSPLDSPLNGIQLPPGVPAPNLPPPTEGPGTELKKIFAAFGISPSADCQCDAMVTQMNIWGPAGCEDHRGEILAHLNNAYAQLNPSWTEKSAMAAKALALGIIINPLDPAASVLDAAVARAK